MDKLTTSETEMPDEIDFSKGVRGLHHIPAHVKVFRSAPIELEVLEYFTAKARERGVSLSDVLTKVLQHEIDTHEVLK